MKNNSYSLRPGAGLSAVLLLLGGLFALIPVGISSAADPRAMTFSVVEFNPPRGERVVLDNGMILYLLEDHELPLIKVNAMIRTGGCTNRPTRLGWHP